MPRASGDLMADTNKETPVPKARLVVGLIVVVIVLLVLLFI